MNRVVMPCLGWFALVGLIAGVAPAHASNVQSFRYQGRMLTADGTGPLRETVALTLGIYGADGQCLLYEESLSTLDLAQSDGYFSIDVGSPVGAARRTAGSDPGNAMATVFANTSSPIPAKVTSQCPSGNYHPATGAGRRLRVTVTPQAGSATTLSPDLSIHSVPQATVAETVQGLTPAMLLQIVGSSTPYVIPKSDLNALLGPAVDATASVADASAYHHHDSRYLSLQAGGGVTLGANTYFGLGIRAGDPAPGSLTAGDAGKIWFDSGSGAVKFWDGLATQALGYSDARARGTISAAAPLTYNSSTGQMGLSATGTITTAGIEASSLRVTGGTPAAGKVLTSDASGNATWQAPPVGGGGGGLTYQAVSSNYTVTSADQGKLLGATGGPTITLPDATAVGAGFQLSVKQLDTTAVTIAAAASQTIDGSASIGLPKAYSSISLVNTGSQWIIANRYIPTTPQLVASVSSLTGLHSQSPSDGTCQTLQITNSGQLSTSVISASVSGYFTRTGCTDTCTSQPLGPSLSCTIGVRGTSATAPLGPQTGTLVVSAAQGGSVSISLAGNVLNGCDGGAPMGTVCAAGVRHAGTYAYGGAIGIKELMVATAASGGLAWGPGGATPATDPNDGLANTASIMAINAGPHAASYCDGLTTGGYSDWYLPAKNELDHLYNNRGAIGVSMDDNYWSSTENTGSFGYIKVGWNGSWDWEAKSYNWYVALCIRRF